MVLHSEVGLTRYLYRGIPDLGFGERWVQRNGPASRPPAPGLLSFASMSVTILDHADIHTDGSVSRRSFLSSSVDSTVFLHSSHLHGCVLTWHTRDLVITNNFTNSKMLISNKLSLMIFWLLSFHLSYSSTDWCPHSTPDGPSSTASTSGALCAFHPLKSLCIQVFVSLLNQSISCGLEPWPIPCIYSYICPVIPNPR